MKASSCSKKDVNKVGANLNVYLNFEFDKATSVSQSSVEDGIVGVVWEQ